MGWSKTKPTEPGNYRRKIGDKIYGGFVGRDGTSLWWYWLDDVGNARKNQLVYLEGGEWSPIPDPEAEQRDSHRIRVTWRSTNDGDIGGEAFIQSDGVVQCGSHCWRSITEFLSSGRRITSVSGVASPAPPPSPAGWPRRFRWDSNGYWKFGVELPDGRVMSETGYYNTNIEAFQQANRDAVIEWLDAAPPAPPPLVHAVPIEVERLSDGKRFAGVRHPSGCLLVFDDKGELYCDHNAERFLQKFHIINEYPVNVESK